MPPALPPIPDISVLPPQLEPPAPQITPELEQLILDQPLPESEPEPTPDVELEPPMQQQQEEQQPLRRLTRQRKPPAHFADYVPYNQVSFEALTEPTPDTIEEQLHACTLSNDPDVLHLWQAMKEPDWLQFQAAMQREIDEHEKNGNWEIVLRSSMPNASPPGCVVYEA